MNLDLQGLIQTLSIAAIPVIFAITLHEAAHGYVARHFGDMTAHAQGRISLNPARHIDLVGTIVVPLVMLLLSGGRFLFGWAKPVPVNYFALRRPKSHMAWVAAAGPAVNFLQAIAWAAVLRIVLEQEPGFFATPLRFVAAAGITVNLTFAILNLVPILPLDGGRIVFSLLPDALAARYGRMERFGLPLVLGFILLESHFHMLEPIYRASLASLASLFGLAA